MRIFYKYLFLAVILLGCGNNEEEGIIKESGTVETTNIIISSKVSGEVKNIIFDEGEQVNRNDTILIIDAEDYLLRLQQAKAQRDIAEAKFELMQQGAREEDISQAQENLAQAEANFNSAKDDFARMENLYESKSVTKKQHEDAGTRLKIAKAQYQAAKQNLQKVKNITRPLELVQAKASLNAAEAQVKLLQKKVNDCYVSSPIQGYMVEKYVEIGETVMPQTSLCKLSDLSEVEVVVYIPETALGKVKPGQKAGIFSDTFPEKTYEGKVTYISPEAEFTPKNIQTKEERTKLVFSVKITVPNPGNELKAGMPVDAEILIR